MLSRIRSTLRWLFGIQALVFLANVAFQSVTYWTERRPALLFLLGMGMTSVVCGMAWWTARRHPDARNGWAIAACLLNFAVFALPIWYLSSSLRTFPADLIVVNLLILAGSLVGVYAFAKQDTTLLKESDTLVRRVAGDRTNPISDKLLMVLFGVAIWVAAGAWFRFGSEHDLPIYSTLPNIFFFVAATLINATLHECGHALVATVFRMKLLAFNAGPFLWRRLGGKWKFQLNPSGVLGGAVAVVPIRSDQQEWPEAAMILAGPLVNFVTAPLFFWAVFRVQETRYESAWLFLAYLATMSIADAAFNFFPLRTSTGQYSDGARLLQLLTDSPALQYQRAIHRLQSTLFTPLRSRDLDPVILQRAADVSPHEFARMHAHLCISQIYEDQGRISDAAAALVDAETIYRDGRVKLSSLLHSSFIYFHAVHNRDAAAARLWWNRMQTTKIERRNVDYWLAASSLHWIEGRLPEAEQAWRQADAEVRKLPHFGAYEFDRDRVAYLRKLLDQPVTSEPVTAPESSVEFIPNTLEPGQQPA